MTTIPRFETDRLVLRPHRVDDFDAYHALWSDVDVVKYIGGLPSTREGSWARLMRAAGLWHHLGFGFLAIEEKESGRLVGEAGFHEVRRTMTPSIEGTLETGWLLKPEFHGRGYASEALSRLIAWGSSTFPAMEMTAIIHPLNAASLRLAARLGFQQFARADLNGEVILLSRRTETPPGERHSAPSYPPRN